MGRLGAENSLGGARFLLGGGQPPPQMTPLDTHLTCSYRLFYTRQDGVGTEKGAGFSPGSVDV